MGKKLLYLGICFFLLFPIKLYGEEISYAMNFEDANPMGARGNNAYTPMFEVGKEWHYVCKTHNVYDPQNVDYTMTLKVVEKREFEGCNYYKIMMYSDTNAYEKEKVFAYFMEDESDAKVYLYVDNDFDGINNRTKSELIRVPDEIPTTGYTLVYDYRSPGAARTEHEIHFYNPESRDFELKTGWYPGYVNHTELPYSYISHSIVEGVGYVSGDASKESLESTIGRMPSTIRGFDSWCINISITGGFPGIDMYYPYLYSVVGADGREILSIDAFNPAALDSVVAENELTIAVSGRKVTVDSNNPIGNVTISNMQGVVLKAVDCGNCHTQINLDDLLPGIYIVTTANHCKKFVLQ